MRACRPFVAFACLFVLAAAVAGCGGSDSTTGAGHGREDAKSTPAPPKSDFPAPDGMTLRQLVKSADNPAEVKIETAASPAAMVFYPGTNRYPFGVFKKTKGEGNGPEIDDAEVAIYIAKAPSAAGKKSKKGVKGAVAKAGAQALDQPAIGPFPARIETLATQPQFESRTTADDPDAADVVYVAELPFPTDGQYAIAALVREGDEINGKLLSQAKVGEFEGIPRPGERAPRIHTPTAQEVGGDLSKITTRVPPDHQNKVDYAEALGKEPILLLFATPQFCQSRVCGPVVDVAEEAQAKYGDQAQFIHMEIYNDNDPGKGVRPQVRDFHLPSEPWLFAVDRQGVITSAVEGAFGAELLDETVRKAVGR
jgi:hypothetical protein